MKNFLAVLVAATVLPSALFAQPGKQGAGAGVGQGASKSTPPPHVKPDTAIPVAQLPQAGATKICSPVEANNWRTVTPISTPLPGQPPNPQKLSFGTPQPTGSTPI